MIVDKSAFHDYDEDIIYIHHFATDLEHKGLGKAILLKIKELNKGKRIRLDNIGTNEKLNEYYEKNGFRKIRVIPAEQYDGKNFGILRELELT